MYKKGYVKCFTKRSLKYSTSLVFSFLRLLGCLVAYRHKMAQNFCFTVKSQPGKNNIDAMFDINTCTCFSLLFET